jgi:hypothetical protein
VLQQMERDEGKKNKIKLKIMSWYLWKKETFLNDKGKLKKNAPLPVRRIERV